MLKKNFLLDWQVLKKICQPLETYFLDWQVLKKIFQNLETDFLDWQVFKDTQNFVFLTRADSSSRLEGAKADQCLLEL